MNSLHNDFSQTDDLNSSFVTEWFYISLQASINFYYCLKLGCRTIGVFLFAASPKELLTEHD